MWDSASEVEEPVFLAGAGGGKTEYGAGRGIGGTCLVKTSLVQFYLVQALYVFEAFFVGFVPLAKSEATGSCVGGRGTSFFRQEPEVLNQLKIFIFKDTSVSVQTVCWLS